MTTIDPAALRAFELGMEALGVRHEVRWVLDEMQQLGRGADYFDEVFKRRQQGEPLAYIFGHWQFRGFELRVAPGVLIPRPETEELVDLVLERMRAKANTFPYWKIVDAGAGSGCLGLALHLESGAQAAALRSSLTLIELSPAAQAILEVNVNEKVPDRCSVKIFRGSWLDWVPTEKIQVLVSNPPYISGIATDRADADVETWEPREALYPTDLVQHPDASGPYRELMKLADLSVECGGIVAFELGAAQENWIGAYARDNYPLWEGRLLRDMAGKNRFWIMERSA